MSATQVLPDTAVRETRDKVMLARGRVSTLNAFLWEFFAMAERYWTLILFFSSSSLNAGEGASALPPVNTRRELPAPVNVHTFEMDAIFKQPLHAGRDIEHVRPICILHVTNLRPA